MASGPVEWTLADSYIWARLHALIRDVERLFGVHQYGEAGRQIYEFMWGEFADWYIEIAKLQLAEGGDRAYYTAQTLVRVLDGCLRLLHPFTPFVTEELWGHLKAAAQDKGYKAFDPRYEWEEALMLAHWPKAQEAEGWEEAHLVEFGVFQEVVKAIRNLRAEKKIAPSVKLPATFVLGERLELMKSMQPALCSLAGLDSKQLEMVDNLAEKPGNHISLVVSGMELFFPAADLSDPEEERARMQKELQEIENQIERLETLLKSDFANRAPAAVVDRERQKLEGYRETAQKLRQQLG